MPVTEEIYNFIRTCYKELGKTTEDAMKRVQDLDRKIRQGDPYQYTSEEIAHGAKMAWRNSNRCIGRLFWQSLHVFDKRELQTTEEIADALYEHIQYATNSGRIRPTITIFNPHVRIWNHQLIRYAGYETGQGIIGDPHSIEFTRACENLGWQGDRTNFDVLPLVIQLSGGKPHWFPIPDELILEVDIRHPDFEKFDKLGLKWYAVPMISDMALEIGGIRYPAAPFNGWYMETEIGARNLADTNRYNMLPKVADIMGLNIQSEASLWRDKSLVELNVAVLHSFKSQRVTIVDHHTAAQQFKRFEQSETQMGRELTGDWTWLIPPVSPAQTHIFHNQFDNSIVKPNYFYQDRAF